MRVISGGASMLFLIKREVENLVRDRMVQFMATQEHMVSRDEFQMVKMMAENALLENVKLQKRIELLEDALQKSENKIKK